MKVKNLLILLVITAVGVADASISQSITITSCKSEGSVINGEALVGSQRKGFMCFTRDPSCRIVPPGEYRVVSPSRHAANIQDCSEIVDIYPKNSTDDNAKLLGTFCMWG